jgi:hypothetical protein
VEDAAGSWELARPISTSGVDVKVMSVPVPVPMEEISRVPHRP